MPKTNTNSARREGSAILHVVNVSYLVPLSGPRIDPIELRAELNGQTIGRHEQCEIPLPTDAAENVSRFHARFDHDGSRWRVTDLGSRWGTFVNGIKLAPNVAVPLSDGDLIRISPWTFTLSPTAKKRGLQAADDAGQTMVRTIGGAGMSAPAMAESTLSLLLEIAGAIHGATDEKHLAEMLIDSAMRGTGMQNAAVLRPIDSSGSIEIIVSRFSAAAQSSGISFSRSLISAASSGNVAEINPASDNISQSIVQLKISSAICVPLVLGDTLAAFLYLDSRGTLMQTLRPGASAFCVALGRMASLAFSNLKRVEMEKRETVMRAELSAAAVAQKWIMPKRLGSFGKFTTIGESRPGQYVGGDFFDIIPLDENRIAVAVGDVSGKGVSASVLMTATQGFLHSALISSGEPGAAVTAVNRFVNPRRPENKFVTMWVGIFDVKSKSLRYVDAGHGYALLHRADGSFELLDKGGGLPIGVDGDALYSSEAMPISSGDRVIVVSDGIIEQFGILADGSREQFHVDGLRESMRISQADPVAELISAVIAHAGTEQLSDDATAVLVQCA